MVKLDIIRKRKGWIVAIPIKTKGVSTLKSSLRLFTSIAMSWIRYGHFTVSWFSYMKSILRTMLRLRINVISCNFLFRRLPKSCQYMMVGRPSQPGWQGGEIPVPSWSIKCEECAFKKVVSCLDWILELSGQRPSWKNSRNYLAGWWRCFKILYLNKMER